MSKREITPQQQAFLDALFSEAQGDPNEAKRLAGYAETTKAISIISALKEEIIAQAQLILAMNSPRASFELVGVMLNPNQANAQTKLKAVESILNRVGVESPKASEEVNLKVPQGGLFILPAKKSKKVEEESLDEEANETKGM